MAESYLYQGQKLKVLQVNVLNGAAVSEVVATHGWTPIAIKVPTGWTTANVQLLGTHDATVTPVPCTDPWKAAIQFDITANTWLATSWPAGVPFLPFLQLASVDSGGTGVNQGADRTVLVLLHNALLN